MTYRRPAPTAHLPIAPFCGLSPGTSGCRGSDIKQRQQRPRLLSSCEGNVGTCGLPANTDPIWNSPLFSPAEDVCRPLPGYLAEGEPPQARPFARKTEITPFVLFACMWGGVVVVEIGLWSPDHLFCLFCIL